MPGQRRATIGAETLSQRPTILPSNPQPAPSHAAASRKHNKMFFELRQYKINPGKQAAWVKLMEEEIIPFQTKQGMDIRGSWVGEEDESQYFWMRGFESEEERERLYKAVYESDAWTKEIAPKAGECVDSVVEVTRIVATPKSGIA